MIVVRMELWPGGDESRKKTLGIATICNEGGTVSDTHPPYSVKIMKSPMYAKSPGVWKRGIVKAYPRESKNWGPWELLALALHATIGDRISSLKTYLVSRERRLTK